MHETVFGTVPQYSAQLLVHILSCIFDNPFFKLEDPKKNTPLYRAGIAGDRCFTGPFCLFIQG